MILDLIRHGKTDANEQHLYCGSTDLPLSSRGMEELQHLHYHPPVACRFITSGMIRTEQTLQILFGTVPHQSDSRFRELNFGVFEMKSYEQLKNDIAYLRWISGDNDANLPPDGESGRQMRRRVCEALHDIQSTDQNTVLIVHGGTIAVIMGSLFPHEERNRYTWQPTPGHGYRIEGHSWTPIP